MAARVIALSSKSCSFKGWGERPEPIILPLTDNLNLPAALARKYAFLAQSLEEAELCQGRYSAVLVKSNRASEVRQRTIFLDETLHHLEANDIVRLNPVVQDLRVLFRVKSEYNSLLVTERCNSYCLMCSQPPRKVDDSFLIEETCTAITHIPRSTRSLGITGGEPTLLGEGFFRIARQARNFLPNTLLHVLTNGRTFSNRVFTKRLANVRHPNLVLGIPLYSDQPNLHDFVVQAAGAFDETIKGILNLKAEGIKIELRVVVHKQTYDRLPELARFIARNLTFVDQVALMGLELTGFTKSNLEALWIDPYEYRGQLAEAVSELDRFGMQVKIFNHQLCVLEENAQSFAVRSISDWKNDYLDVCAECTKKDQCGGFFSTGMSLSKHSLNIRPFKNHSNLVPALEV